MNSDDKQEPGKPSTQSEAVAPRRSSTFGRSATIIFLSFVASFLGAWVFLRTGLVEIDSQQAITQNRKSIVVQEGEVVADVAKKVSPSVVSIVTENVQQSSFLGSSQSAGTGIIVSRDGYILTNKHVIGDASQVTVVDSEGTTYEDINVVGEDPLNDLAFLKINKKVELNPAEIGDSSQVKVGQKVVAIGNALGQFQNSVTSGIISGRGRPVVAQDGQNNEQLDNLFQTDASINPGNSGGPLLDLNGQVIAINTAIAEDAEGIGFAIPIDAAKGLIEGVLSSGKVQRAYLGVRYLNITPDVASAYNLNVKKGAYVFDEQGSSAVVNDSPADKAGLKNKDIITKVGDVRIDKNNGLALLLAQHRPGDKVKLTVLRNGSTKTIEVTLSQYKQP